MDSQTTKSRLPQDPRLQELYALRTEIDRVDEVLLRFGEQDHDINDRWSTASQNGEPVDDLRDESRRLTGAVDTFYKSSKTLLFGSDDQFIEGRATFIANVGRDYFDAEKNPTGYGVLEEALRNYVTYFDLRNRGPEEISHDLEIEMRSVKEGHGSHAQMGAKWRYHVTPLIDETSQESVGLKLTYFHNSSNGDAPGASIREGRKVDNLSINDLRSQLRFRKMMANVEIKLLEEKVDYELS